MNFNEQKDLKKHSTLRSTYYKREALFSMVGVEGIYKDSVAQTSNHSILYFHRHVLLPYKYSILTHAFTIYEVQYFTVQMYFCIYLCI